MSFMLDVVPCKFRNTGTVMDTDWPDLVPRLESPPCANSGHWAIGLTGYLVMHRRYTSFFKNTCDVELTS